MKFEPGRSVGGEPPVSTAGFGPFVAIKSQKQAGNSVFQKRPDKLETYRAGTCDGRMVCDFMGVNRTVR
jgi:hypothetical protein